MVRRLRAEGALVIGKANMDEFGMGCVAYLTSLSDAQPCLRPRELTPTCPRADPPTSTRTSARCSILQDLSGSTSRSRCRPRSSVSQEEARAGALRRSQRACATCASASLCASFHRDFLELTRRTRSQRPGNRHRRLDSVTGLVLRYPRLQAFVRPAVTLRRHRLCEQPRHGRHHGERGGASAAHVRCVLVLVLVKPARRESLSPTWRAGS